MKKYSVDLISHVCLSRKVVYAKNKEEAKRRAMPMFDKFDIDQYDEIDIQEQESGEK